MSLENDRNVVGETALRRQLEQGYAVIECNISIAPTGETFTEVYGHGGAPAATMAFESYAKDKHGKLYWRIPPELYGSKFYMRLLISSKEPVNGPSAS